MARSVLSCWNYPTHDSVGAGNCSCGIIIRRRTETTKTVALERQRSNGSAGSRLVRSLFYLADGLIGGAVLYFGVSIGFFAFAGFDGFEIWMLVALLLAPIVIGPLVGWTYLVTERSEANGSELAFAQIFTEWKGARRWRWVAVVAIPVAAILVGVTIYRWGWELGWLLPESMLLMSGTLGVGFVSRILLRHTTTREH